MRKENIDGIDVKIMGEFSDPKYGQVLRVYMSDKKGFVIDGKLVKDEEIIKELNDKYGTPDYMRKIVFEVK